MKLIVEERQDAIRRLEIEIGSVVSYAVGPGLPAAQGKVLGLDEDDLMLFVEGRKEPLCPCEARKVPNT